jgi:hypothetical protein
MALARDWGWQRFTASSIKMAVQLMSKAVPRSAQHSGFICQDTVDQRKRTSAQTDTAAVPKGGTVLLVENEPAMLKIGKLSLRQLGYKVLGSNDHRGGRSEGSSTGIID